MNPLPRIAVPVPYSRDEAYNQRALRQYCHALQASGAEPVIVPLDDEPAEIARLVTTCEAVLLPGSPADIDPQKYNDFTHHPRLNQADVPRDTADELLLQDAYNMRKPILGICYGLQSLNVWRSGTLRQHIESPVNHSAGREVARAHTVAVEPATMLAEALAEGAGAAGTVETNSSHHQAVEVVGDGLRVAARCPEDGLIEALEGTAPAHFVLGVQWHPERTFEQEPLSRALFQKFVQAAAAWRPTALPALGPAAR